MTNNKNIDNPKYILDGEHNSLKVFENAINIIYDDILLFI
jgi:hypothetical protein